MQSTESQIIAVIKEFEAKNSNNEQVLRLEDANELFEQLVSRGVVRKRGYNLVGADSVNAYRYQFEVQS
jgi:hypothetical protein